MKDQSSLKLSLVIILVTVSCVAFSAISACGHKGAPDAAPGPSHEPLSAPNRIPSPGIIHSQRLAREAQVGCADEARCPEAVGMVVATLEGGVDQCTGFLIANDLVATSSRCIPSDLRSGEGSCGERIRVYFPGEVSGGCSQVIVREDEAQAFIRLTERIPRRPIAISESGFPDGMEVAIPVMNPVSGTKPLGEIRVLSCQVAQKTAVLPAFEADLSPVAALGGCRVGLGNLGAPVLDPQGRVRGIVKTGFQEMERYQKDYGDLLGEREVADFAFASNLACVRTPLRARGASLPDGCLARAPERPSGLRRAVMDEALSKAQQEVTRLFQAWKATATKKLGWDLPALADAASTSLQPSPMCFDHPEQWLEEYRHWYLFGGYDKDAQVEVSIPRYEVSLSLSSLLQPKSETRELKPLQAAVFFSPRSLAAQGQSPVTIRLKDSSGGLGANLFPMTVLKKCQN